MANSGFSLPRAVVLEHQTWVIQIHLLKVSILYYLHVAIKQCQFAVTILRITNHLTIHPRAFLCKPRHANDFPNARAAAAAAASAPSAGAIGAIAAASASDVQTCARAAACASA